MSIFKIPFPGLITLTGLVAADTLRELYNGHGQTPCCVAQQLIAPCQVFISQDCGDPIQDMDVNFGSACTCNTVVFNLWSGCLDLRNATMPYFNTWATSCQANNTMVIYNDYPLHDVTTEVEIPTWAYINLAEDSSFDLATALRKARGWTTVQVVVPVILGMSALGGLVALYFWYRRRMLRRIQSQESVGTWRTTLRRSRHLLDSSTQVRSSSRYRKSWAIDDFVTAKPRQSIDSDDDQNGYVWLTPAPPLPSENITQKLQQYIQPAIGLWRNPFKRGPVQVVSLPPRQGFRVDDSDVSTNAANSRRPTADTYDGLENGAANQTMSEWSVVHNEEIFDARDDGLDERSVLLISRAPGVDFTTSPTTESHIVPPSRPNNMESPAPPDSIPLSLSPGRVPTTPNSQSIAPYHYPNPSMDRILRPSRTDPIMLFPASVRAAGYTGVPTSHLNHSHTSSNGMPSGAAPMISGYTNHR